MSDQRSASAPRKKGMFAYAAPMIVFVVLLGVSEGLKQPRASSSWLSTPEFWIYPLQTLLCGALLIFFRREYELHRVRRPIFVVAVALFVFLLWIAPQQFLHFPARRIGFNPDRWAAEPRLYWITLVLRFLRLVIVVPLVEEIFWRGLLLRYFVAENFEAVPFGAFSWPSFTIVTFAFALSHSVADWPAALITGALYNFVAYRTKSLSSCVLAHGLTNLSLGLWIMATGQWGFW
ncbi:MAG: CAAX prenyl protease-related protein [Chthoniobacterales bacterium]